MNAEEIIRFIHDAEKKTPVKVYDPERADPIVYRAGDYIRFFPISEEEYEKIAAGDGMIQMEEA